ncbi:MAG: LacI family DNA-binding transcriptional regulator [Fervidobacterium sp.]
MSSEKKRKERKFATIKDIASIAGVSVNTVSRALSNRGYVKKEKKEYILRIAQELGYTRNCAASSLRTKHSNTIGVVVVDNSNPFYAEVVKGIETEARKNGYSIILVNTDRSYENEVKAIQTLLQRRVDGLIICAVQSEIDDIKELVKKKIPTVVVGSVLDDIDSSFVCSDDETGGFLAVEYLLETGHRNILFLNAMDYKYAARLREKGAIKAVEKFKKSTSSKVSIQFRVINSLEGFQNAYDKFKEILVYCRANDKDDKLDFDAVLCYNDIFAYAVLKASKESNFKVPDDFSVVGFDDIEFSSLLNPPLTTIGVDKLKLGSEAFYALMRNIKEDLLSKVILPVYLVKRESVKIRQEKQEIINIY